MLKVVFVMLRNLGAQMNLAASQLTVNSNLIAVSIVGDSSAQRQTRQQQQSEAANKVDLSAPIELVFEHERKQLVGRQQPPRCVYWDAAVR